MSSPQETATVDADLRLGGGIEADERDRIVDQLKGLDTRLRSFRAGSVELLLTVKERDTPSQRTTLEAWIAGEPRLVATSTELTLTTAITEVRNDLTRQISDAKNRREPRNNRQLRDTQP